MTTSTPSIRIATFGPKLPEWVKLYTPIANDPGNDGVGVSRPSLGWL